MTDKKKIIVGISGASGAVYAIRLLEVLRELDVESHLVISKAGAITIVQETGYKVSDVVALADFHYNYEDIGARIASGSFQTMGMIVVPCAIKSMSEIACGITGNLLSRSADVVLKERRKLVIMLRETPLHLGYLRNLTQLAEMGAVIAPPLPAFYPKPESVDELVDHSVGRILDLFDIDNSLVSRWEGF